MTLNKTASANSTDLFMMPASPGANTGAKPIEKKILHAGTPGTTTPELRDGTRVRFHFACKDMQGATLDDSRKWDHTPSRGAMELVMGKKFKLECWETCLTTMSIGEVASFTVKKQVFLLNSVQNFMF